MLENSKILVGKIVAPQGLRGEVRVQTYTTNPEDLKDLQIIDHKITFVRRASVDVAIVRVDDINDRNGAENLRGTELYVMRDSLPELNDDEFYQTDLIGMTVIMDNESIGTVATMHNFGAGDILELDNGEMFSFNRATVDKNIKTIYIK